MEQKEITETFMMISKWKNFGLHDILWKYFNFVTIQEKLYNTSK